jgi:hypothetical protein
MACSRQAGAGRWPKSGRHSSTIGSEGQSSVPQARSSRITRDEWLFMAAYASAVNAASSPLACAAVGSAGVGAATATACASTSAVYQTWNTASVDESTATWPGVANEDGDPADFEKLRVHKRGCELAVEQTYGLGASLVARAGSIMGPHDNLGQLPVVAHQDRRGRPGDCARRPGPRPAADRRA